MLLGRRSLHERIDTASATCNAPTARVKHNVMLIRRSKCLSQRPLCLMSGEARRAEPSFLVTVRVADQHTLGPIMCLEVAAI